MAYVSSTITVTGANFICSFACTAKVGANPISGTATKSCTILDAATAVVVVGANTLIGASSVELNFTRGAVTATVPGTPLEIIAHPTATSIAPTSASNTRNTITVTGTNFISGFACTAKVGADPISGTAATSCTVINATTAVVVIGGNPLIGASSVELKFTNGAVTASVPGTTLDIFALRVSSFAFTIASSDRVVGKSSVPISLAFTPTKAIPSGGTITLTYPPNFFASPVTSTVAAGASSVLGLSAVCSVTSVTAMVITVSGASINASSVFTITISGFTIGNSGANVSAGITLHTSSDPDPSIGVNSGHLSCPAGSHWTGQTPTCTQCPAGTFQNASDAWSCTACNPGRFCNVSGLTAVSGLCPSGSYSPSGADTSSCTICAEGTYSTQPGQHACMVCARFGFTTTRERDGCVTLEFTERPPSAVFSEDFQGALPALSLVDVDGNVMHERSGNISASLQCGSLCDSELAATLSNYDLFPAVSISIVNGVSTRVPLYFTESSQGKIGSAYVWKFSSQDNGPPSRSIPAMSSFFYNISFMGRAPVYTVAETVVASVGGTVLSIQGEWTLPSRVQRFFNSSAFCEFEFISASTSASTILQSAAVETADVNLKTCRSPSISEFTKANLTIVFQDGRRRKVAAALSSVCHHGFYVDAGKCVRCPSSSLGRSTNIAINAPSLQDCFCDAGHYGTYGANCRLCPKPASLSPLPFICNSTNLRFPVVAPGYWADFSLLSNCIQSISAPCEAVKTCAFGVRACPGGGEKSCTQSVLECYEGVACTTCCKMFYLENEVCTRCPDASQMTLILSVVGAMCIVLAAITISSASPSLTHSLKYFVIIVNFLQRLFSLQLIKIDWPIAITGLFGWLKLFTLSINIVRPECSFNWNYQTKVILTLLTPVCVSLVILCCAGAYGWSSCRSLWRQINRTQIASCATMACSLRSLFWFWIEVVLFRNADLNCRNPMWTNLYPILKQCKRRRRALPASENWACLRDKLKSARKAVFIPVMLQSRSKQLRYALENFQTLDSPQQSAQDNGFVMKFARIVTNGRKFASAMFSVLVFTFMGTLTSVLSVWNCKPRDGKMYLSEDANIECSLESSEYRRMFSVSVFGLILYGVGLPVSILSIFRSRWCTTMAMYDFGAFDTLFGFLTSRYSRKYYMWEVIIFVQKTISVLVPTYVNDAILQSVFMTLAAFVYLILIFVYNPYGNGLLNFVEKVANLNIFLFYFSALLFAVEVDGALVVKGTFKDVLGLALCVLCALSVAAAVSCSWYEWLQLAVLHKIRSISNWMKCLHFTIGSSFSGDSAFSLLTVMYNPVSRRDVANKQLQFHRNLANALLPLHQEYIGNHQMPLFGVKKAWIHLKFAIRQFDQCSPVSILSALDQPHTAFIKNIARLNVLIKNGANKRNQSESSLLRRICNVWNRRNKIAPEPIEQDIESDAPKQFIKEFLSRRKFVDENIDDEVRLTLITLLLFNRMADFREDGVCQHYLNSLFDDGAACRVAMRSIFDASQELSERYAVENSSSKAFVSFQRRLQSWLLSSVFGEDTVKPIVAFHRLTNEQQNELMKNHNFPDIDSIKFSTTTADDMLAQSLSDGDTTSLELGSGSEGMMHKQSAARDYTSLSMERSGVQVEAGIVKYSVPHMLQTDVPRNVDLEAQNSELKRLLSSCKNENAELKTVNSELNTVNLKLMTVNFELKTANLGLKNALVTRLAIPHTD